jgi:hypothetical protein
MTLATATTRMLVFIFQLFDFALPNRAWPKCLRELCRRSVRLQHTVEEPPKVFS